MADSSTPARPSPGAARPGAVGGGAGAGGVGAGGTRAGGAAVRGAGAAGTKTGSTAPADRLEHALASWAAGAAAPPAAETFFGVSTLVLVEGDSDRVAVREAARLLGVDLHASGVAVAPMGGAMSVRRFVAAVDGADGRGSLRVRGLCDVGEVRFFERAGVADVFVCRPDLEGELIAALGVAAVEEALEREGDLRLFRRFQRQPAQRGRAVEGQLHRFFGTTSGRKEQYARVLTAALPPERVPSALRGVLGA